MGRRPGTWGLLQKMLLKDPQKRISSQDAQDVVNDILSSKEENTVEDRINTDGAYFDFVIQDLDICTLPSEMLGVVGEAVIGERATPAVAVPRPLHYVATFDRYESLGLVISEAGATDDVEDGEYLHQDERNAATTGSNTGDVFVRDIVVGGQAERIGVIEIGDRIAGVGEFTHQGTGFEGFLSMIEAVPPK